ncbi:MAG: hypothetical protein M0D55_01600 [Elusimicrobiota bacterium]|nr:MAG: hypothetical protein M0D55_01600 [Elusimicrobiota bacterium]
MLKPWSAGFQAPPSQKFSVRPGPIRTTFRFTSDKPAPTTASAVTLSSAVPVIGVTLLGRAALSTG